MRYDPAVGLVLIPLPGIGTLALDTETYKAGLAEGAKLSGPLPSSAVQTSEPLHDAEYLAKVCDIPASWIEQAAREGKIPCYQFGRWRRFKQSEVEAGAKTHRRNDKD